MLVDLEPSSLYQESLKNFTLARLNAQSGAKMELIAGPILLSGWLQAAHFESGHLILKVAGNGQACSLIASEWTDAISAQLEGLIGTFVSLRVSGLTKIQENWQIRNLEAVTGPPVGGTKLGIDAVARFTHTLKLQTDFTAFLGQVRNHLIATGCVEVKTPSLVVNPGMEINLEPFEVQLKWGSESHRRYLPTSPELTLKKYLCHGLTDAFEIRSCFRNNEKSEIHAPEFTMLELYRTGYSITQMRDELAELFKSLGASLGQSGRSIGEVKTQTVAELFAEYLDFSLRPETTRAELAECGRKHGLAPLEEDTWEDVFHRLLVDFIEPRLAEADLFFVTDYPAQVAALAKIKDDGFAARFEAYLFGVEIANGFDELTDAREQEARFKSEYELRLKKYGTSPPIDTEFLRCLSIGMPATVGVAVGLERVYMGLLGINNIRELDLLGSIR